MEKHELLKYAYDNFPKGTKFKSVTGIEGVSTGVFRFLDGDGGIVMDGVYRGGLILGCGFEIWATVIEDRKPLFTTFDGVDIYVGDNFYSVFNKTLKFAQWSLGIKFTADEESKKLDGETYFSTKQVALDWIEKMNKPKEIRIDFSGCTTANVSKNAVKLDWIGGCISLGNYEIKQIMDAFDRLK